MILINKIKLKYVLLCTVILWVLAFPQSVKAQELSGAFIMSSVGSIPNFSNNSMPIAFTSNSSCFNLQNGIAVLNNMVDQSMKMVVMLKDLKYLWMMMS